MQPPADADARLNLASSLLSGTHDFAVDRPPPPSFLAQFDKVAVSPQFSKDSLEGIAPELVAQAEHHMARRPPWIPAVMAAMLLKSAYEWADTPSILDIPDWLAGSYAVWRLSAPRAFERLGQSAVYSRYAEATFREFDNVLGVRALGNGSAVFGGLCFNYWNMIQLYFNESGNAEAARFRARICETTLMRINTPLSWVPPERDGTAKTRIGIVMRGIFSGPESFFLFSHVETFPKERCELMLFLEMDAPSGLQDFARSLFDETRFLAEDWGANVEMIRAENLDIVAFANNIVALPGALGYYACHRLAKTQLVLSASPMTTGYVDSDIFLSSAQSESPGPLYDRYTEEVYTMPGMLNYYAFQHDKDPQTINVTRAMLGIPDDAILFVSIANYYKTVPELVESWASILKAVPNSMLLVMPFSHAWGSYELLPYVNNFINQFGLYDVSLGRVLAHPSVPTRADVLSLIGLADVYLDSYPFSGACSLLDPLLARVPLVQREGPTFRSRFGATMLRFAGLDALITTDKASYEEAAIRLGRDPAARQAAKDAIRNALADGMPYFDVETMPKRAEEALFTLSQNYEAMTRSLASLSVPELKAALEQVAACLAETENHFWNGLCKSELIRLFAPVAKDRASLVVQHDMPALAVKGLESRGCTVSSLMDFSALAAVPPGADGSTAIDLLYFALPPDEVFRFDVLGVLQPPLIMIETGPVSGPDIYGAKMLGMRKHGYDFIVVPYATGIEFAYVDLDNRPLAIHGALPDEPAESAVMIFFPAESTKFLARLLETLDRFLPGRDRTWTRLVPEGQRESVMGT